MAQITNFLTVPAELQAIAHTCRKELLNSGYSIKIEYLQDHFPETATIFARRGVAQYFYLFDARIKRDRIGLWSRFGRSCSSATFVILCVPHREKLETAAIVQMQNLGVGLTLINADGTTAEMVPPIDLTLNVSLPPLERHRAATKRDLAVVHEYFERGDWKGGFERACKTVENYARKYLRRQAKLKNVKVPGKKGVARTLTIKQIEKMPLGALANVFCDKLNPFPLDALLCTGLKRINPDRIKVAHHLDLTSRGEQQLRSNVSRHMWAIDNMLRAIPD